MSANKPKANASSNNQPIWVASSIALLGALTALFVQLPSLENFMWSIFHPPESAQETYFNAGLKQLEDAFNVSSPVVNTVRTAAYEAYRRAEVGPLNDAPQWKCQVVDLFYSSTDPAMAHVSPILSYSDYNDSKVPNCSDHVFTVAKLDWDTFQLFRNRGDGDIERLKLVKRVVAKGTTSHLIAWAYLGRTDSAGHYTIKYIGESAPSIGKVVKVSTTSAGDEGILLHDYPPERAELNRSGVAGFLPDGSTFTVLGIDPVPEPKKNGAPTTYLVFAKANVEGVEPLAFSLRGLVHPRLRLAHEVHRMVARADTAAACPPVKEQNSLHSKDQQWVYVGQKLDTGLGDAFVPGTSRLDSPCVPRDGEIVRAARDLKVLTGADPHYPGVASLGGVVSAGTDIRVVGDVAGYPFDATVSPGFCNHDPVTRQHYDPIPAGHEKRYCVYVPFTPS